MRILAIETSTDETGLSLVESVSKNDTVQVTVLADVLASQAKLHNEYGGVYPSLAKREHAKNLGPLLRQLLSEAGLLEKSNTPEVPKETLTEIKVLLEREPELFVHLAMLFAQIKKPAIDALAVTYGPGLEPALWVGVNFAKALARAWDIPLIPINHMEGHIVAATAHKISDNTFEITPPQYPTLSLLISGGHTEIVLTSSPGVYERIGKTRDDAVGEAFDKSARLLGLPYPGGPEISKLAHKAEEANLEKPYSLPRPMIFTDSYDFSFSGLKTAVRNLVADIGEPTEIQKQQVALEFENAVTEVLIAKVQRAIDTYQIKTLVVGGGVSANARIRNALSSLALQYEKLTLHLPDIDLSTDNGRMIAFTAVISKADFLDGDSLRAQGNLTLDGTSRRATSERANNTAV